MSTRQAVSAGHLAAGGGTPRCHGLPRLPQPVPQARAHADDPVMRGLTVAVMLSGLSAVYRANLLSAPMAVLAASGCVAGSLASRQWPSGTGATVRRGLSLALLALAAVSSLATAASSSLTQLSTVLATAVVELAVAHALVQTTRRDLVVGTVVGGMMLLLAAGTSPGSAVSVPLVLGASMVVAQLVVARRAEDLDRAHQVARAQQPFGSSPLATAGRSVAVVLLVTVFALLLVPHPAGAALRSRLAQGGAGGSAGPATPTRAEQAGSGAVDLRARGQLSDRPVLQVPADSPVLWRSTVLDTYQDSTWLVGAAVGSGGVDAVPSGGAIAPPALDGPVATGPVRVDRVRTFADFTGVVAAPGRVTAVDGVTRLLVVPGAVLVDEVGASGYRVATVTTPSVDDLAGRRVEGVPRTGVPLDPTWTRLPDTVPARVLELGHALVPSGTDAAQAVRTVEDFVRHRATYTLDSPVPAAGEDAVDDFLFVSQEGFCEQFASAEVVLLRAAGVPARLVTGYAAGGEDRDGMRTYRGTDAHAWVEAWVPGAGWVSSDPTAGTASADSGGGWWSAGRRQLAHLLGSVGGRIAVAVALAAALVLAGCAVLLVRRNRRPSVAAGGPPAPDGEPDPLPAFRRLESALAWAGSARGPAESLGDLARRLPTSAADAAALTAVGSTCYAEEPPGAPSRGAAAAQLDHLTARLAGTTSARTSRRNPRRTPPSS